MSIQIIGNGSFGSFLREIFAAGYISINDDSFDVILAVPISAYDELGAKYKDRHLINVCSVQEPSTEILLKHTKNVTSIHPLFGQRTPVNKRRSILTYVCKHSPSIFNIFEGVSKVFIGFDPKSHDEMMAKTHLAAVQALELIKPLVDKVKDIDDDFIPHSFRLLREFAKTIEDMPPGTLESIKANKYAR